MSNDFPNSLATLEAVVFDVDGVLTDNLLLVQDDGALLRMMNSRDGYGLKTALRKGIPIAVVSGGTSGGVQKRLEGLGVQEIHLNVQEKLPVLEEIAARNGWDLDRVAYVGDDWPDLPCLRAVGLPIAPADAPHEIRDAALYVTTAAGGRGVGREVCELVLRAQRLWPPL
jgi:3-deoxy-D-manno-octulosonate 8-phosphate phosphatase (KDO 8-P phosphatase)